eukprot:TRINITY_DN5260_c0_g1_i2.p1 TRINITY_DN5260_c0_g1~~TRINITY_DN5260_c0_g1_i2.p1  ORF type:complete len:392 (-),score=82.81 TRINITY_DN5260_c0_g1_i2:786-1961(-)
MVLGDSSQLLGKSRFQWDIPLYTVATCSNSRKENKELKNEKESLAREEKQIVVIGGGGGSSKTGILNKIAVLELYNGVWSQVHSQIDTLPDTIKCLILESGGRGFNCAMGNVSLRVPFDLDSFQLNLDNSRKFQADFAEDQSTSELRAQAFSPDGKWLSTGGVDGLVRLWNPTNHSKPPIVLDQKSKEEVIDLCFSLDSRFLVVTTPLEVIVWDVEHSTISWKTSIDKKESSQGIRYRNSKFVGTGSVITLFIAKNQVTKKGWIRKLEFRVLENGTLSSPKLTREIIACKKEHINAMTLDHQRQMIGVGTSEGTVSIFTFPKLKTMMEMKKTHNYFISAVAFTADGKHIISVSGDYSCMATAVRETLIVSYSALVVLLALFFLFIALYASM